MSVLSDDAKKLIGCSSKPIYATDVVERGAVRRFAHAIMDDDPLYWNDAYAASTKYRGVCAPPLYPLHAFRRAAGEADPLEAAWEDADFDGAGVGAAIRQGLPELNLPLKRLLNGGNDVTIHALARLGDTINCVSRYADIYEKEGRSGTLIFVIVETTYRNQDNVKLLVSKQTYIWR